MTADEIIAVIKARQQGKMIECRSIVPIGFWIEASHLINNNWDFSTLEYRVKPQLKTIWLNIFESGICYKYNTKDQADREASLRVARVKVNYTEGQFDE